MLTKNTVPLSAELISKALREFQLEATPEQVAAIQRYMAMLLGWNEKMNLTAIRDPLEVLYRHFCESMYAAVTVPLQVGRLADVGSGGVVPRGTYSRLTLQGALSFALGNHYLTLRNVPRGTSPPKASSSAIPTEPKDAPSRRSPRLSSVPRGTLSPSTHPFSSLFHLKQF